MMPDEPTELKAILVPAQYVTAIHAGPTFRVLRTENTACQACRRSFGHSQFVGSCPKQKR